LRLNSAGARVKSLPLGLADTDHPNPCTGTPSRQLPNALLKAMACALPCAVARVSGSHELVQDGRTGAAFPTDAADGLCQAHRRADRGIR